MVVGGDISQTSIEYAKTHYAQHGLHFCLLNAHRLPFNDESFDVVVSIETIEHLEKPMQFLSECYRVLKPGGEFVCSTPNKKMASPYTRKPLEPSHVKEFDIDELRSLAEEHFPSVTIVGQFYHKDSTWRLNILAGSLIGPFFRSFPKGESIIYFLNRFIFRRKYVTLSELDEMMATGLVKDDVLPFPQEGKDIGCIILVARK